jgi:hypothetical protein
MNTPLIPISDNSQDSPEWHEPFPEPQTIPLGWNLSGLRVSQSVEETFQTEPNTEKN